MKVISIIMATLPLVTAISQFPDKCLASDKDSITSSLNIENEDVRSFRQTECKNISDKEFKEFLNDVCEPVVKFCGGYHYVPVKVIDWFRAFGFNEDFLNGKSDSTASAVKQKFKSVLNKLKYLLVEELPKIYERTRAIGNVAPDFVLQNSSTACLQPDKLGSMTGMPDELFSKYVLLWKDIPYDKGVDHLDIGYVRNKLWSWSCFCDYGYGLYNGINDWCDKRFVDESIFLRDIILRANQELVIPEKPGDVLVAVWRSKRAELLFEKLNSEFQQLGSDGFLIKYLVTYYLLKLDKLTEYNRFQHYVSPDFLFMAKKIASMLELKYGNDFSSKIQKLTYDIGDVFK